LKDVWEIPPTAYTMTIYKDRVSRQLADPSRIIGMTSNTEEEIWNTIGTQGVEVGVADWTDEQKADYGIY